MNYAPDCADCPSPEECREKNDCQVTRQIRHPTPAAPSRVAQLQAVVDERTAIMAVIDGGSFMHNEAPVAQWARELKSAIQRDVERRERRLRSATPKEPT